MKNALILHGTLGNSNGNWFQWLKEELEKLGYKVWVPDLPGAEQPDLSEYTKFILGNKNWVFDNDSVIIGHSSGAQAILKILESLPSDLCINQAILVAGFIGDVDYPPNIRLRDLKFDWKKIKQRSRKFVFVHSDDDPFVDLKYGKELKSKLGGKLIILKGQKHFSTSTGGEKFRKLPIILELLNEK